MKLISTLLMLVSVAAISGCSTMKISSETLADYDFASIDTYQWVDAPEKVRYADDTLLSDNLQSTLNFALTQKGWKEVSTNETADVQVVYYVKLSEYETYATAPGTEEGHTNPGFTYEKDSGNWSFAQETSDVAVYHVEMAELILELTESSTGKKLWSGSLTTKMDRSRPPTERKKLIHQASNRITARIPGAE